MPNTGLTNTEGTIIEWLRGDGDVVEKGEPVVVIATDKVTTEVEAPASGVLRIVHPNDATVAIAATIGLVLLPGEEVEAEPGRPVGIDGPGPAGTPASDVAGSSPPAASSEPALAPPSPPPLRSPEPKLSPAARRLARELGLTEADLSKCCGTGPDGRITSDDIRDYAASLAAPADAACGQADTEVIPLSGVRAIIAERMVRSVREAPQFHIEAEIAMDRVVRLKERLDAGGVKHSFTEIVVKAIAAALRVHPMLNCFVSDTELVLHRRINIGIAVGADSGLIVPVVRDADTKGIDAVTREVKDLVGKARAGTLAATDLADGTFTFSNLGMFGIDRFSAIINPPQAAILTMGRIRRVWTPIEDGGAFRRVAAFTLTVDHRAVDGLEAAKFMHTLASLLEGAEIEQLCNCCAPPAL